MTCGWSTEEILQSAFTKVELKCWWGPGAITETQKGTTPSLVFFVLLLMLQDVKMSSVKNAYNWLKTVLYGIGAISVEPLREMDCGLSSLCYLLSSARLTDGENNSSNGIKLKLLTAVITCPPWYQQKPRLLALLVHTHTIPAATQHNFYFLFSHTLQEEKPYRLFPLNC